MRRPLRRPMPGASRGGPAARESHALEERERVGVLCERAEMASGRAERAQLIQPRLHSPRAPRAARCRFVCRCDGQRASVISPLGTFG
jgi:hypothetical protein